MSVISSVYNWLRESSLKSEADCRNVELSLLVKNIDSQFLDLGCADGKLTLRAAEKIGTSKIYGIEIADDDINKAKANGINVHSGDLNYKLPLENESFDVVFASHVIEHLSATDTFVKEIYRVLKVGGYLVIATPNLASAIRIIFLLFGRLPPGTDVSDEFHLGGWHSKAQRRDTHSPGHRRMFTVGALKELLENYGFKVEKVVGTGYYPLPNIISKIICNIDKRHSTNIVIKAAKPDKNFAV